MPQRERTQSLGIMSPGAPWRRAARPLAILFSLQLSGIGCAARTVEIAPPSKPSELEPYLQYYEGQLEEEGISVESAESYLVGRSATPLPEPEGAAPGAGDYGVVPADGDAVPTEDSLITTQGRSEPTFKVIDGVAEYRIGPGDVLQVTTFLGPEQPVPRNFRVQADGNLLIARFNIGAVQAAGMTATEVSRTLTDRFRQYAPGAFVEVTVLEYNAWSATLMGAVRIGAGIGPGRYTLDGRITATDFLFAHGGPLADADLSDVRLIRDGTETRIDLTAVIGGLGGEDPTLQANDLLRVPSVSVGSSASQLFLFGELRLPGVYPHIEGISVLDAIGQAGGFTSTAGLDKVYLSRPSTAEVIPVDLNVYLGEGQGASAPITQPGDFIVVPFRDRNVSERLRDWVSIASLILSAATIIALINNWD